MKIGLQIHRFVLLFVAALCLGGGPPESVRADENSAGAVYTLSNASNGSLEMIGFIGGLPWSIVGLAAE